MYDTYGGVMDAGKKKRLLIVGVLAVVAVVVAIIIYFVMKTPACPAGHTRDPTSKLCVATSAAAAAAAAAQWAANPLAGIGCNANHTKINKVCYPNYTSNKLIAYGPESGQVSIPFPPHEIIRSYEPGKLADATAHCEVDPTCQGRLSTADPTSNITLIRGLDGSKVDAGAGSGVYYFYKTE